MDAAHELYEKMCQQIGEAEILAALDMTRYDRECRAKKDDRRHRMIVETRALREQRDAMLQAMVDVESAKPISLIVPDQHTTE